MLFPVLVLQYGMRNNIMACLRAIWNQIDRSLKPHLASAKYVLAFKNVIDISCFWNSMRNTVPYSAAAAAAAACG